MKFDESVPTWIRELKPGDRACNCKGEHRVIARIEEEVWPNVPSWLKGIILFTSWLPDSWQNSLPDWFDWDSKLLIWVEDLFDRRNWVKIHDRELIFVDGSTYFARPCCSPDDHEPFDFECQRDL